jgi:hypothetical protein
MDRCFTGENTDRNLATREDESGANHRAAGRLTTFVFLAVYDMYVFVLAVNPLSSLLLPSPDPVP